MKTYAAIFAILTAFLAVAIVVLTGGCVGKGVGVNESGRDTSIETGTAKIATSGPVVEAITDVKADVEAALVKSEKRISTRIEAARDSVQNEGVKSIHVLLMFIGYFVVSKVTDIARDWIGIRRSRGGKHARGLEQRFE